MRTPIPQAEDPKDMAIRLYREKNMTVKQVARQLGIRNETAGEWLRGLKTKRGTKGTKGTKDTKGAPSTEAVLVNTAPVLAHPVNATREAFVAIVNKVGIETALDWMSEITREKGRSLRRAATAMEIANEQIAQVLERTRTVLGGIKH